MIHTFAIHYDQYIEFDFNDQNHHYYSSKPFVEYDGAIDYPTVVSQFMELLANIGATERVLIHIPIYNYLVQCLSVDLTDSEAVMLKLATE